MMWRQGDIYITSIKEIPSKVTPRPNCVLAEGEVTGHSHRIDRQGVARMFSDGTNLYLEVFADTATVVHEEHGHITLDRGTYRVWRQREYSPEAIHIVRD